jgi:hypothetical protein
MQMVVGQFENGGDPTMIVRFAIPASALFVCLGQVQKRLAHPLRQKRACWDPGSRIVEIP